MAKLPPLREVIARHELGARKSLGQHFLLDLNLTRRIVRAAGDLRGIEVIEIGPGPGGLTRALLASEARRVIAVEQDPRCVEALQALASAFPDRLQIVAGDALALDVRVLSKAPRAIIANLPYNIATPLLIGWLANAPDFTSLTLMFQTEVAERLYAKPRSKAYGRLSILAQWRCRVLRQFDIPARAFTPPPKVSSTVVRLEPYAAPLAPAEAADLTAVTAAAFGQRRKMLRASLKQLVPDPLPLLASAGIVPTARAEELSVEDFCRLARAWRTAQQGDADAN
ncbi:MAG: 16S rRNA (adenine(1518)-N(6)/adenine(1519)-N(6))-dimethyltransferase RsmA [Alphaproteobacteria bacterium]|nr:16S rRNA (adenine(1518)-N(6)/adenine(1519)-N(6))-dimethyltransferase RsmA [Alphaproteobacteria bacterium]